MNYRHAFHAGNFADVVKHVALTAVILHLRKKDTPFRVIDSHAGRGLYDLNGLDARRTAEAEQGIARLVGLDEPGLPASLAKYLDCVRQEGDGAYPGSARIAARLLRATDRLTAIEKHPDEAEGLRRALAPFAQAKAVEADGYERLPALLPPSERRGVILVDPPYEASGEFERVADLLALSFRRFVTGTYLVWFPIKSAASADAFCGEMMVKGVSGAIRVDVDVGGDRDRLVAAGLLVVNPPHGFADEMNATAPVLASRLGRGGSLASITIRSLQ